MKRGLLSIRVCFVGLMGLAAWAGCGGGGGPDVSVRVAEKDRPDIAPDSSSTGKRSIPTDAALNVIKFTSGQEGEAARGFAGADERQGATCHAEVTGAGSAWGAFQIGYTFDNMTGKALLATFRLKTNVEGALSYASPPDGDPNVTPTGSAMASLILKDTLGVVVRQESLYTAALSTGAKASSRGHDAVFEARLEPGRGYYFVVTGRAEATCLNGQNARIELAATNVNFEIAWRPADVQAAVDSGETP